MNEMETKITSQSNKARERNKKYIEIGEEKLKLFPFADFMILYLKSPRDHRRTWRSDKHFQ
jgi:hypothetical protein